MCIIYWVLKRGCHITDKNKGLFYELTLCISPLPRLYNHENCDKNTGSGSFVYRQLTYVN